MDAIREELILSHLDLARSIAHRGAMRGERYEDLEGAAMEGLVIAAAEYNEERPFRTEAYYWCWRKVRQELKFLASHGELGDGEMLCDDRDQILEDLTKRDEIERLYEMVGSLPPMERTAVEQYYLYGIPASQVAAHLHLSRRRVYSLLQTALRRMHNDV